jgi:hypothetical protein
MMLGRLQIAERSKEIQEVYSNVFLNPVLNNVLYESLISS